MSSIINLKAIFRHEGLRLLLAVTLAAYFVMLWVPDRFLQLSHKQKIEYIKTLRRRVRKKTESIFNLNNPEDECN